MSKRQLTTPEELRDFLIGKDIFRRGGYLDDCLFDQLITRLEISLLVVQIYSWNGRCKQE